MHISWQEFFKRRFEKPSAYYSIGIEFGETALHISTFSKTADDLIWAKQHTIPIANWLVKLKEYVDEHKLANTPCRVALSIAKYQILQIDKPKVAETEITQALQWPIKEQLPGVEELVFDYFDYPASSPAAPKLNVIAIPKQEIEDLCQGIVHAGLKLVNIGIEELATSDLVPPSDDAVITLFQEAGEQICLNIVKQNKLFFSRRLRGYENLSSFSLEELQKGIVDTLSIEIQRSMDYFESQLRQAPVKKIFIALDCAHQDELVALIAQLTFLTVEIFKPDITLADDMQLSMASYASLGAGLGHQTRTIEAAS
jgi:MSHA biogenesis protein MshI